MQSGPSWQVSINDPFDLVLALYLRDRLGLPGADDVPPLVPPVPRQDEATYADRALAEQWLAWWTSLLTDDVEQPGAIGVDAPDFTSHAAAPALQAALRTEFEAASRWRNEHRLGPPVDEASQLMPTYLVAELEQEAGRRARPFRFAVDQVPTCGLRFWDLSPARLLVSEELAEDTETFRDVLRPRLGRLL